MKARGPVWLMLAALSLGTLALGACSKRERSDDCGPSERVVDPLLLAFLSQARSSHHVADEREAQGDVAAALRALQTLTQNPKPPGSAPEVDEVLADTRARIADLLSRSGRYDQADEELKAGLENAKAPSYFRGHLFEVQGLVEERREKALRGTARGQEADRARERSLIAYEEAMKIQAAVIRAAAPAGSASPK
jgi:tetratricopeptide (TPR) repeat protein